MNKLFCSIVLVASISVNAQVAINTDGTQPGSSAGLDVKFSNKGVLIPRLTFEQRTAIANPAEGLLVYCTTCTRVGTGALSIYEGGRWKIIPLDCPIPYDPSAGWNTPSLHQITWNWNSVPIAEGYKINTIDDFTSASNLGPVTSFTETGLNSCSEYSRYLWAYNSCGQSSSFYMTAMTLWGQSPPPPVAGIPNSTLSTITWNWNSVPDATGYLLNSINDYYSATDIGSNTTSIERELACGSSYSRYLWAYNNCGVSSPVTMTQSTLSCSTCGAPLTINHTAGAVAPVSKTVTYGTIINIQGEPSKCWITSNLGADHQAIAVNDATEASAGWYWQFNRKQGYKHDGTTRTPNTAWTSSINENLDWQAANDPCSLELGAGWRIPTNTEWTNVDASGNWTDWNGPWSSGLKLHAAGGIWPMDGSLTGRGIGGNYSSNQQSISIYSWYLTFNNGNSYTTPNNKAFGMSLRCIKD
ncbi:MAG: hypothetical protein ACOYMF_00420 [Bacteroidales bacterium]